MNGKCSEAMARTSLCWTPRRIPCGCTDLHYAWIWVDLSRTARVLYEDEDEWVPWAGSQSPWWLFIPLSISLPLCIPILIFFLLLYPSLELIIKKYVWPISSQLRRSHCRSVHLPEHFILDTFPQPRNSRGNKGLYPDRFIRWSWIDRFADRVSTPCLPWPITFITQPVY